jgi:DNA-binding GntR family transcriptional regulator
VSANGRRDAVTQAHEFLRDLIVRGEIAPGSELSQVELARRVGVSTTPLREALRRLEAEGLVDSRQNHRPRVRPFLIEELDSIYAARILLEGLAMRLTVPTMEEGQLATLARHIATMSATNEGGRATAVWQDAHFAFHQELVAAAEASLKIQIENLMSRADRYIRFGIGGDTPTTRAIVDAEHADITEACQARDGQRAASLLAAHLAHSAQTIGSYIAPGTALVAVDAAAETAYAR